MLGFVVAALRGALVERGGAGTLKILRSDMSKQNGNELAVEQFAVECLLAGVREEVLFYK